MSLAKSLSEEQVARIQAWADEGAGLPEIQSRIDKELGVKVTYMETRFLLGDLGIELKPEETPAAPEPSADAEGEEAGDETDDAGGDLAEDAGGVPGKVTVTISELQRPGMALSGRATFSSGKGATWFVDQLGRLGLDPDDKEYRPSQEEMASFQQELQRAVRSQGYY